MIDRIIRPGVQIQQVFLQTNPALTNPDLPTVIVGLNRQIVRNASAGDFTEPTSPLQLAYPNLESLAVVDMASVRVKLTSVVLDIFNDGSQVTFTGSTVDLVAAGVLDFTSQGVKKGDDMAFVQIVGTTETRMKAKVVSVTSASKLVLDRNLSTVPAFATPTKFTMTRVHEDVELPTTAEPAAVAAALNPPEQTIVLNGQDPAKVQLSGTGVTLTTAPAAGDFTTAGTLAGDVLFVTVGTQAFSAKVVSVDAANQLTLDADLEAISAATGPVSFLLKRVHTHTFSPFAAVAPTGVTLAAGVTIDGHPLFGAHVTLNYMAVRQLTADKLTAVQNASDISTKLIADVDGSGAAVGLDPLNELALGVFMAKANTVSSVLAMGITSDTPLAWADALARLENEGVYTIVLLTQDPAVQGMLKTHVDGMSVPEKSRFRMGFVNLANPVVGTPIDSIPAATLTRTAGVVELLETGADFSPLQPGDFVKLTARPAADPFPSADPGLASFYRVKAILNLNTLQLDNVRYASPAPGVFVAAGPLKVLPDLVTPDITDITPDTFNAGFLRALNRDGQAMAIAQAASAYNDRRITYITNGEIVVNVRKDATGSFIDDVVPGYMLAAAYGGMNAGNPPHQGFTNVGVVGVKAVHFGSKYYNDTQAGLIAGSGGFLVIQDADTALPAAYLQTTTDNSSIQRRELSVTKTLDFYSLGLKKVLSRYIGPYNIYGATLSLLDNAVRGWHTFLLGQNYDKIGSPILSGSLKKLAVDPNLPDTVRLTTDIAIPIPLNYILATVEVVS